MPKYRSFDLDKLYEQVETSFNTYPSEKLASLYETKSLFLAEIYSKLMVATSTLSHTKRNEFKSFTKILGKILGQQFCSSFFKGLHELVWADASFTCQQSVFNGRAEEFARH